MDQRFEWIPGELKWLTWKRALVAIVVVLAVLEIGTFAFNWTWTGFEDNSTVWDWLQLLVLPLALAAVPVWFTAEEKQQRLWLAQLKWVILVAGVVLVVLFLGTFALDWSWTGFKDHGKIWDWLSLLLVPVTVAVLPIWYSIRQSRRREEMRRQQHQLYR